MKRDSNKIHHKSEARLQQKTFSQKVSDYLGGTNNAPCIEEIAGALAVIQKWRKLFNEHVPSKREYDKIWKSEKKRLGKIRSSLKAVLEASDGRDDGLSLKFKSEIPQMLSETDRAEKILDDTMRAYWPTSGEGVVSQRMRDLQNLRIRRALARFNKLNGEKEPTQKAIEQEGYLLAMIGEELTEDRREKIFKQTRAAQNKINEHGFKK